MLSGGQRWRYYDSGFSRGDPTKTYVIDHEHEVVWCSPNNDAAVVRFSHDEGFSAYSLVMPEVFTQGRTLV